MNARVWRRALLGSPVTVIALLWLLTVVVVSIFASKLAPYPPLQEDLLAISKGPSLHHLLGTDELGRDVLSRLMFGGGTLLWGAAEATLIAFVLGVPAGMLAGYSGGKLDRVLSWLADLSFALPAFIVVIALAVIYPQNVAILMGALGVIASGGVLRLARNLTNAVRDELYMDAARASGLRRSQILIRHVLPVIAPPLVVQACLGMAVGVIVLASLSFLGLGTNPEVPNWGQMIYEASQQVISNPWLMVPSGLVLVLTVMALSVVGSSVRELAPGVRSAAPAAPARRLRLQVGGRDAHQRSTRPGRVEPQAADAPLLEVRDLTIGFFDHRGLQVTVDHVSFSVGAGETLGLVGESGCGKSLSVLALPHLLPVAGVVCDGSIRFDGVELVGASAKQLRSIRGARIGFVSQDPLAALDPSFTVGSQLREVIRVHAGGTRKQRHASCVKALEEVGIIDPEGTSRLYPHQISGGMAQRVAIAIALCGEPELLIADEPTTALDVTVQAEILQLLRTLKQRRGMAMILVTHDMGVVADSCDRVAVMYAGQVVEDGPTAEVLAEPRHPYTLGLLSSMPDSGASGERLEAIPGTVPIPRDWLPWCRFEPRCPHATQACRAGAIELGDAGPQHASRCVRIDALSEVLSV
ncbi:MAG TPA: dipeptide/oligopeptide/nickel ABC transporter permease/ATP-binding protein [Solirubrobacteraceae bacterium]|nr:dipeptide/oligopeptide/nickel ABC transporter permease/ATP-binding protein [Solirubrobacteraceae bacterium]